MKTIRLSSGDASIGFEAAAELIAQQRRTYELRRYLDEGPLIETGENDTFLIDDGDPFLEPIVPFFNGLLVKGTTARELTLQNLSNSTGTTGCFRNVLLCLKQENEWLRKTFPQSDLGQKKPTIVILGPFYTNFGAMCEMFGFKCLAVHDVKSDDRDINADFLHDTLVKCTEGDQLPVAFFDSNPNNPTGRVRNQSKTDALALAIHRYNMHIQQKYADIYQRIPAEDKPIEVRVIDDMVYWGTEHDWEFGFGPKDTGIFAKSCLGFDYTISLFGVSKIGLPNYRAGIAITNTNLARRLRESNFRCDSVPALESRLALSVVFNNSAEAKQMRAEHFHKLADTHIRRFEILRLLIDGEIENPLAEKIKDIAGLKRAGLAERIIKNGMEDVHFDFHPDSGFFVLIDFYEYFLKHLPDLEQRSTRYMRMVTDGFQDALKMKGLSSFIGAEIGLPHTFLMRASVSMPEDELIEGWLRVAEVLEERKTHLQKLASLEKEALRRRSTSEPEAQRS